MEQEEDDVKAFTMYKAMQKDKFIKLHNYTSVNSSKVIAGVNTSNRPITYI